MRARQSTSPPERISFEDLALAAVFLYCGHKIALGAPSNRGLVTFTVPRDAETERLTQDYATSSLRVDPRRFYDALGIAKRLVHRAKERVR